MFSWTEQVLEQAKHTLKQQVNELTGQIDNEYTLETQESKNKEDQEKIHYTFELPIQYLPKTDLHELSSTVNQDLELVISKSENSMYEHLFQPSNPFGKSMIKDWSKSYTSNIEYLEETQQVVQDIANNKKKYTINHEILMEMWDDTKNNSSYFLEKYCFIEWDVLKSLNKSPEFLQTMSFINMSSPVISLLFPILFFIFPFIILKIRGIPITFSVYLEVLQDIAKHHFIGKIMTNISSISPDKLIYLALMVGLYFYQIYQNIQLCIKFYKSIHKINEYLFEMREYLGQSIERMEQFVEKHRSKNTYSQFCKVTEHHINTLSMFYTELEPIKPLTQFVFKIGSIGYLLKCYYELHSNIEYDKSIRYSFGFEGYLDNLRGIAYHLNSGTINIAKYNRTKSCKFQDEYYPAYFKDAPVKNTCKLNKKMIITGPNASGKTTLLKTTTINIIFAQQIGCGFFKSCTLNPYTHIHSYLNIPDTSERDSLFQAESRRCKEIIDVINKNPLETKSRHFCIFDELYSGTNPSEATKSAYAFLKYLTKYSNVDFILTTHYASLCKKLKTNKQIRNYMMNVLQKEDGKLEYEYKLKSGISKVQGAIRILEDMNYPKEIIDEIKKI